MTRPTRAGVGMLAAGIVGLAVGRLFGAGELYVLGAAALVVVLVAWVWTTVVGLRLGVGRTARPARLRVGSPAQVDLTLTNRNPWPTGILSLHDAVGSGPGAALLLAPLGRRKSTTVSYRVPSDRRGPLTVGPLRLTTGDPLGLTAQSRTGAGRSTLVIHPEVIPLDGFRPWIGVDPRSPDLPVRGVASTGDEFFALRPYETGDELRRVHWPSSARKGELVVRQTEERRSGWVTVVLDVDAGAYPDRDAFERAVSAADSIVYAFVAHGQSGRFATGDAGPTTTFATPASAAAVDTQLAHVERSTGTSLARRLDQLARAEPIGHLVLVTGSIRSESAPAIAATLRSGRAGPSLVVLTGDRDGAMIDGLVPCPHGPGDDLAVNWPAAWRRAGAVHAR